MNKKRLLYLFDALLLPGMVLCKWLSRVMLSQPSECPWTRYGGKCVTCGGTHFVNSLLSGDFAQAIEDNVFLFSLTVLLAVVVLLAHLDWIFCVKWAQKLLKKIFSIPSLVLWGAWLLVFFFARNLPLLLRITQTLFPT